MARWLRLLLSLLAAAVGFFGGIMAIGGMAGGLAWIFVFGDDPWPDWAEPAIFGIAVLGGIFAGLSFGLAVWRSAGRR